MAHFAELDGDSKVIRVLVVANENAPNEDAGIAHLKSMNSIPNDSVWKQCSYNTNKGTHTRGGTHSERITLLREIYMMQQEMLS